MPLTKKTRIVCRQKNVITCNYVKSRDLDFLDDLADPRSLPLARTTIRIPHRLGSLTLAKSFFERKFGQVVSMIFNLFLDLVTFGKTHRK